MKKKQLVVYVAGPYRAEHEWGVTQNIRMAEAVALEVWKLGAQLAAEGGVGLVALCPHKNTAMFGGACPDAVWLEGDLELLRRSDAVLLVPGWEKSSGTRAEVEEARRVGLPVYSTLSGVENWARELAALKPMSEFEAMLLILGEAAVATVDLQRIMSTVDESLAVELDDAGGMLDLALTGIRRKIDKGWVPPERVTGGDGAVQQGGAGGAG